MQITLCHYTPAKKLQRWKPLESWGPKSDPFNNNAPVLTIVSFFAFVSIFLRYYEDGATPDIWWAAGWRCLGRRSGLRPVRHRATPPFIRAAALLHFLLRWPVPNPYYTSYYAPLTLRCPADTTTALFRFLLKLIHCSISSSSKMPFCLSYQAPTCPESWPRCCQRFVSTPPLAWYQTTYNC